MSKGGRRRQAKKERPGATYGHAPQRISRAAKLFLASVGFVATVLGIISFTMMLGPKISVFVGPVLDSRNPFKSPLIIKNEGYVSVRIRYALNVRELIQEVELGSRRVILRTDFEQNPRKANVVSTLRPNHSQPIELEDIFIGLGKVHIDRVELRIRTWARHWSWPYEKEETFLFRLRKDHDGRYIWFQYALTQ